MVHEDGRPCVLDDIQGQWSKRESNLEDNSRHTISPGTILEDNGVGRRGQTRTKVNEDTLNLASSVLMDHTARGKSTLSGHVKTSANHNHSKVWSL
ncbi:uncharacterized protein H6S33_002987 [Morchella sextelata]|uniref:uncharacterized protein n=1 Tax=Morchella sextelata TaxID=1174677 RepID=UPI001D059EDC|nr:uncharacterized protein H6S33_002987 [Morchella sextelata]KAH0606999.1 hypothetical protein H6S33_002987 [Morchella sextelata]